MQPCQMSVQQRPDIVADSFRKQLHAAKTIEQVLGLMARFAVVQKAFEEAGTIRKPPAGDSDVLDALKSIITDQISGELNKLVFSTAWDAAHDGIEKAVEDNIKDALWEALNELIEQWLGEVAKEIVSATKSGSYAGIPEILLAAVKRLLASLKDTDSLTRRVLRALGKRGVVTDQAKLRRALIGILDKVLSRGEQVMKIVSKHPVAVFLRLMLTPSNTPGDRGFWYQEFELVRSEFHQKVQSLMPELPLPAAADFLRHKTLPPAGAGWYAAR